MSTANQSRPGTRQHGAALLLAMLIVALVASLAATATWQQRQSAQAEADERAQQQAYWLIRGALNWAKIVMVQDNEADRRSASAPADHLNEPWAVPLAESRLGTFLTADNNVSQGANADLGDAFFSGAVVDLNGRLNLTNLVANQAVDAEAVAQFQRLFLSLGIGPEIVPTMATQYLESTRSDLEARVALTPTCVDELVWLGLSVAQVEQLRPYVTVLPQRTKLNLNTASERVLSAALPEESQAAAASLVAARARSPLLRLEDAQRLAGELDGTLFQVTSEYFMVGGHLRLEDLEVRDRYVIHRNGSALKTVRRECSSPFAVIETATGNSAAQ